MDNLNMAVESELHSPDAVNRGASVNDRKQEAYELGLKAEAIATDYLVSQGYAIKERRWKPLTGKGEIDIIAQIGSTIVFVEVKARSEGAYEAIEAVDRKKRRYMALGADKYLGQQPLWFEYRFDIIAVDPTKEPPEVNHIPDAFLSPLFSK